MLKKITRWFYRPKSFIYNLKQKEGNANEKIDLDLLKVGNNNKINNSDVKNLANWASWDPHDTEKTRGIFKPFTVHIANIQYNEKSWS